MWVAKWLAIAGAVYYCVYVGGHGSESLYRITEVPSVEVPMGVCIYVLARNASYTPIAQSNELCPGKSPATTVLRVQ